MIANGDRIFFFYIIIAIVSCTDPIDEPPILPQTEVRPWYNIRYDYSNTGYYPSELSIEGIVFDTLNIGYTPELSTPVFDDSGNCYVAISENNSPMDGIIKKYDKNLSLDWQLELKSRIEGSGCVLDSTVIFGSRDEIIFGISLDGNLKWSFQTNGEIVNSPIAHNDLGFAIAYSRSSELYVFDETGTIIFQDNLASDCNESFPDLPAMDSDGNIYVSNCNEMSSIHYTGTVNWQKTYEEFDQLRWTLVYSNIGIIYATSYSELFAIDSESGNLLWSNHETDTDGSGLGIAVDPDGTVYWGNRYLGIEVYDYLGNQLPTLSISDDDYYKPELYPTIDSNNNIYFGTNAGQYLVSITSENAVNFTTPLDFYSFYGITINNDKLYFNTRDNTKMVVIE